MPFLRTGPLPGKNIRSLGRNQKLGNAQYQPVKHKVLNVNPYVKSFWRSFFNETRTVVSSFRVRPSEGNTPLDPGQSHERRL